MIWIVSVVDYLMRSFSVCLGKKTAGDLVRSGYPSRAIYKTQTVVISRLDCDFYAVLKRELQPFLSAAQKLGYTLKGATDIVYNSLKTKTNRHDIPCAEIRFVSDREHDVLQLKQTIR